MSGSLPEGSEAIHERALFLKGKELAQEMEGGYRSEAVAPSLDPEWSSFEVEGLDRSSEST